MMGLEMFLGSLGIDPKELEAKFVEAQQKLQTFDTKLSSIERKLDRLIENLEADKRPAEEVLNGRH